MVAIYDNNIVGTATIEMQEKENWYIRSMAVKPDFQKKNIGYLILRKINKLAKKMRVKTLSLDCFQPLINALNLYQSFGFRKTGIKRQYHGIEIFEMIKRVD